MSLTPTLTEFQALAATKTFLSSVLASTVLVARGQVNRVPQPQNPDFVVMWPILRHRLETNVDSYQDVAFTASIAATSMSVTAVQLGTLAAGQVLLGSGLATGTLTTITGQVSGSLGGTGLYTVSLGQTLPSQQLASGSKSIVTPTELTLQLDVHGPNSGDNAQMLSTVLRDEYAVDAFQSYGFDVTPLYTDDPRQVMFLNAEQVQEERWVVDLHLQVNPAVVVPQAFAQQLAIQKFVEVDAVYPPVPL